MAADYAISTIYKLVERATITADDKGPILNLVAWNLIAATVLITVLKIILSWASFGFRPDDAVLTIATIFSIIVNSLVSAQVSVGLGQRQATLSDAQITAFEKYVYATDIVFILAIASAKAAVLTYLYQITPVRLQRRFIQGVGVFIAVWSVAFVLAASFQCRVPDTWAVLSTNCFDQVSLWTAYGAINIFVEVVLVALPVCVLWRVRISMIQKAVIIACFGTRLTVVAATVVQIIFLRNISYQRHSVPTFEAWPYVLASILVQSLSVITVSLPSIKTLLSGLQSGMLASAVPGNGSFSSAVKVSPDGTSSTRWKIGGGEQSRRPSGYELVPIGQREFDPLDDGQGDAYGVAGHDRVDAIYTDQALGTSRQGGFLTESNGNGRAS